MGTAIARNLLRAGLDVTVWNRTREKAEALAGDGAEVVETPAEAAEGSDIVLTMLNAWLVELVESLAETIAFAQALGFEPELFLETITGGALDSPYAQSKGKEMAQGEFPTSFPLRHAHKDAGLVAQEAEQRALDLPAIRAALAQLDRALELGLGDQDVAAVYEAVRPGVEPLA
jgi:3-hydroxyisobutyrate dehydrogenase